MKKIIMTKSQTLTRTFIFKEKDKNVFYSIPVAYPGDILTAYISLCKLLDIHMVENNIIFVKEI
jgi:hypothetical protein